MRILLDTSAYAAFMRGHPQVHEMIQRADEIALNPIVLGELHAGFIKGKLKKKNENEIRVFLSSPRVNIMPIGYETSLRYAVILNSLWKSGTPIPTNDIWIAATAMEYGLRVVTTDSHYRQVQQIVVDCFGPSQ